jgi:hypothetical protein
VVVRIIKISFTVSAGGVLIVVVIVVTVVVFLLRSLLETIDPALLLGFMKEVKVINMASYA